MVSVLIVHLTQVFYYFETTSQVLDSWVFQDGFNDVDHVVEECCVFSHLTQEPTYSVYVDFDSCFIDDLLYYFDVLLLHNILLFWWYGVTTLEQYPQQDPSISRQ